ncbi:MAG TPA: Hsp33 family molecular chaperone HslO [Bacillota bacterium]|nr:Hsp33 family molecular chaperone HslO [Bacillota bacterium]
MQDYLIKTTAYNGMVRAYAALTSHTIEEARTRQDTWPTASAAMGRTITIAVMMGAMQKNDDTLTVKVEGDGPIGAIIADSNANGHVRGYVINPHVDFELNEHGKLDVARAVGKKGTLSVVKDVGLKDYFTGQTPLISGEISEDFTSYFVNSEQIPSAVGAGVLVNPDNSIAASGGFIVQVMPGADEDLVAKMESRIQVFPPISKLIEKGHTPEEILARLFGNENIEIHEQIPVQFRCRCSKERVERAIIGMGKDEIQNMIEEDHGAEATCHFCNETYRFTEEELEKLLHSGEQS